MARPLYSAVLLEWSGLAGPSVQIPVPSDEVWVVRDVVAGTSGNYWGTCLGFTLSGGVGVPIFTIADLRAWVGQQYHWQGRQVLESSDVLSLELGDERWQVRVSGYVLSAP